MPAADLAAATNPVAEEFAYPLAEPERVRTHFAEEGYVVVRVETRGPSQIVYYRAGNTGKGNGKGMVEKMVIRREAERVLFVDTPSAVLVDIDLRLRF